MPQKREIEAIADAPEIIAEEDDLAGDILLNFFEALGWNPETHIIDPRKIRTTKAVFCRLCDLMTEKCGDAFSAGAFMVNKGPGADDNIPEGKVYLLKGWIQPNNNNEEQEAAD